MMGITHLLATLLLVLLISRHVRWGAHDTLLAIAFGVLVDLDHLLRAPAFLRTHDLHTVTLQQALAWGPLWQGSMHTVWGALVAIATCLALRSLVPALFWSLHMFMDFTVAAHWVVWGSPTEWAIVALLALALLAVGLLRWRRENPAVHPLRYWANHLDAHLLPARPLAALLLPLPLGTGADDGA